MDCGLDDRALPALWSLSSLRRLALDRNAALTGARAPRASPDGDAAAPGTARGDRDAASSSGYGVEPASRAASSAAGSSLLTQQLLQAEDAMARVWLPEPDAVAREQPARVPEEEGEAEQPPNGAVGGWGALANLRELSMLGTAVSGVALAEALKDLGGGAAQLARLRAGGDAAGAPLSSGELFYDADLRDLAKVAAHVRELELQVCDA